MWYLWHKSIRPQQLVSQASLLLLQGAVSGIAHLYGIVFLWIDRSVSVTIGVHLPCIDRLLQGTIGRELLLQNYYNNVSVMSERRVVNSLVPRPPPSFRRLQYGKAGEGLVHFLT